VLVLVHQTFVSSDAELSDAAFHPDIYSLQTDGQLDFVILEVFSKINDSMIL